MSSANQPCAAGNDVVVLTGGGASNLLGLPTLEKALDRFLVSVADHETSNLLQRTKEAIEGQRGRVTKALFEELMARLKDYLHLAEALQRDPVISGLLAPLAHSGQIASLERNVKRALTSCYRGLLSTFGPKAINPQTTGFATTLRLYEDLAGLNGGMLHVYTTNYDCSYQSLASNSQTLSFTTHIDNSTGEFRDAWFPARTDIPFASLPTIYVHRLHGCIAWFTYESPSAVIEVYGAGDSLEIHDDNLLHRMCIKLITSQELGTSVVFVRGHQELWRDLQTVRGLLIWGWSFRDVEVLRAIISAHQMRGDRLRVYYVDPFLDREQMWEHIHTTLRSAPVRLETTFEPERIAWDLRDGEDALIPRISDTLR